MKGLVGIVDLNRAKELLDGCVAHIMDMEEDRSGEVLVSLGFSGIWQDREGIPGLLKACVQHIENFEENLSEVVLAEIGFTGQELREVQAGLCLGQDGVLEVLGFVKKEDIPTEIMVLISKEERDNLSYVDGFFKHNGDAVWMLNQDGAKFIFSDQREDDSTVCGFVTESVPFKNFSHYVAKNEINGQESFTGFAWYGLTESFVDDFSNLEACLDWLVPEPERAKEEPLVDIYDLAFDDEGYLHFQVEADGYSLEGLFRLYDPANGPDLTLVSIDFGDRHPIIGRQWDRIEMMLAEASPDRYNEIEEVIETKERVMKAMEAAGYSYNGFDSHDFYHKFDGDYGNSLSFDSFTEAGAWLDGVVFDDPEVSRAVEEIMHPERFEDVRALEDVICSCEKMSKKLCSDVARLISDEEVSRW